MEGLLFTVFEDLDTSTLNREECQDGLYYIAVLLDKEEGPESFIKYQMIKMKLENRLKEAKE